MSLRGPLRVGVGGPVGSGKTALVERLCKKMRDEYDIAVVTNDIYTKEDAEFLTRAGALAPEWTEANQLHARLLIALAADKTTESRAESRRSRA